MLPVVDVAVVPGPDDVMGEIGVAVVAPVNADDAPTPDELRAHGAADLAAHEHARHGASD